MDQGPDSGHRWGHLFLVGFMGAGKSTVGPLVAASLARSFYDLDDLIQARAGKTVADIFREDGEGEFRRLESQELDRCRRLEPSVIALGGGAFTFEENREIVEQLGISVWLDCSLELCLARVRNDQSRPLLGDDAAMRALFESRESSYRRADLTVRTGAASPEEVAHQLVALIDCADRPA
jgi:shikimate kinase